VTHTGTDCGASKDLLLTSRDIEGSDRADGLEHWLCRPGNDDFVLRSLVSSCSNVVLSAQGLYCATESRIIPRACPDGASGCLQQIHG
jgi:hypothetical protein